MKRKPLDYFCAWHVVLPDGTRAIEIESHHGSSETQVTYDYYDEDGNPLPKDCYDLDYWGRIVG